MFRISFNSIIYNYTIKTNGILNKMSAKWGRKIMNIVSDCQEKEKNV